MQGTSCGSQCVGVLQHTAREKGEHTAHLEARAGTQGMRSALSRRAPWSREPSLNTAGEIKVRALGKRLRAASVRFPSRRRISYFYLARRVAYQGRPAAADTGFFLAHKQGKQSEETDPARPLATRPGGSRGSRHWPCLPAREAPSFLFILDDEAPEGMAPSSSSAFHAGHNTQLERTSFLEDLRIPRKAARLPGFEASPMHNSDRKIK